MKVYELIDKLLDIVEDEPEAQDYEVLEPVYNAYTSDIYVDSAEEIVVIES